MTDHIDQLLQLIQQLRDRLHAAEADAAEWRQACSGRTVSCGQCEHLVQERDEARATVAEMRDEISIWNVEFGDKVHYAYRIPDSQLDKSSPMPPHEFRLVTQQDVEKWMNNPIIKDIPFTGSEERHRIAGTAGTEPTG